MTKPNADKPSGQPLGLPLNDGLGPFAELHAPESEFADGIWHKPLPQGWSGGTLVYTEAQMLARVAAERERCAAKAAPERIPFSDDEWRVRCEVRDSILEDGRGPST